MLLGTLIVSIIICVVVVVVSIVDNDGDDIVVNMCCVVVVVYDIHVDYISDVFHVFRVCNDTIVLIIRVFISVNVVVSYVVFIVSVSIASVLHSCICVINAVAVVGVVVVFECYR